MRVLIDECIDWRLSRELGEHDVKTARQMGWETITNGDLLALASREFDAFVTVDRNLSFQQNVAGFSLAVFVLRARTNRLADLQPLAPDLLARLAVARPSGRAPYSTSARAVARSGGRTHRTCVPPRSLVVSTPRLTTRRAFGA